MLKITQKRKIFLTLSAILTALSVIGFFTYGLNYGIDFTGGSLMELEFKGERPSNMVVQDALSGFDLGSMSAQALGEKGMVLRFKDIDETEHQAVLEKIKSLGGDKEEIEGTEGEDGEENSEIGNLKFPPEALRSPLAGDQPLAEEIGAQEDAVEKAEMETGKSEDSSKSQVLSSKSLVEEVRFESVGPAIGKELKMKTIRAIIVALIAIVLYVACAFRKVSKTISSWKYGVCAIAALFHDIMIVVGVFVLLGRYGVEVNTPFVAALLTILGYSVNDTIVIFDRIRENLPKRGEGFEEIVNISINESLTRSINTSLTTFAALLAIYLFAGDSIKNFILALLIGVATGTYSSIFVASPILVEWEGRGKK